MGNVVTFLYYFCVINLSCLTVALHLSHVVEGVRVFVIFGTPAMNTVGVPSRGLPHGLQDIG